MFRGFSFKINVCYSLISFSLFLLFSIYFDCDLTQFKSQSNTINVEYDLPLKKKKYVNHIYTHVNSIILDYISFEMIEIVGSMKQMVGSGKMEDMNVCTSQIVLDYKNK